MLLWALVIREFKSRYRRSLLGPLWAIIQPLFYMVVFVFIQGILSISSEGTPYIIFTYSALVPWTFFATAVNRCGYSIYGSASIIKKISVSREVYPIASIVISLFEFMISAIILLAMMIWYKVPIGWNLLWVPALTVLTILLTLGIGMIIAAIGTFKQDILFGTTALMQFWMLATPVMYPFSQVPDKWKTLYSLNPMVGIIEGFRQVLTKNTAPALNLLGTSLIFTILLLIIAWPIFRYMSQYFADAIS